MKIVEYYSYRHASSILHMEYAGELSDVEVILRDAEFVKQDKVISRSRGGRVVATKSLSAPKTNELIYQALKKNGWSVTPKIISKSTSQLAADAKKGKIQLEVQFGNMARWYTDVFKFLLSYSADDIEVGILVVPMQETAKKIDENVAYFERVVRELPHAKMGITIPILAIGVSEDERNE